MILGIYSKSKPLGEVEVAEPIGETVQLPLTDGTILILSVGRHRSHPLKLRAGKHPIETLRKIRGFREALHPRKKP